MSDISPVIELRHVKKNYYMGTTTITALKDVSLKIYRGDFITIQGPSGCGKTTLLNLIGLIDDPTSGEILIENRPINQLNEISRAQLRSSFPIIFQFYNLIEYYSAMDNVGIALAAKGIKEDKTRKLKAETMLRRVGLGNRLNNKPEELSGGEKQRVAIARAIVVEPKVILADEPTGDLDSRTGLEILNLFQTLNKESGYTFIIVTHDSKIAALGHRKIIMEDYEIKSDTRAE